MNIFTGTCSNIYTKYISLLFKLGKAEKRKWREDRLIQKLEKVQSEKKKEEAIKETDLKGIDKGFILNCNLHI
jgi:hypothetical protein